MNSAEFILFHVANISVGRSLCVLQNYVLYYLLMKGTIFTRYSNSDLAMDVNLLVLSQIIFNVMIIY